MPPLQRKESQVLRVTQIRVHHVSHKKGNLVLYRKIKKKIELALTKNFNWQFVKILIKS
jgi:hypothetical protein